jgi:hypothetical protein
MKHIWTFSVLFICVIIISCSTSKPIIAKEGKIFGYVHVIGNEPFTKLALFTQDNTTYLLKCPVEIEQKLNRKQGQLIHIKYSNLEQSPEGWMITVIGIESN